LARRKGGVAEGRDERIRFISPEPVLAQALRKRKPVILSEAGYKYVVDWVEDVGRVLRSRDMMVSMAASGVYSVILVGLFALVPGLREATLLKKAFKVP